MGRDLGPDCRLCRREGEKLFLKGTRCYTHKCAVSRREYAPGPAWFKKSQALQFWGSIARESKRSNVFTAFWKHSSVITS